jgi:hypothetical protein
MMMVFSALWWVGYAGVFSVVVVELSVVRCVRGVVSSIALSVIGGGVCCLLL